MSVDIVCSSAEYSLIRVLFRFSIRVSRALDSVIEVGETLFECILTFTEDRLIPISVEVNDGCERLRDAIRVEAEDVTNAIDVFIECLIQIVAVDDECTRFVGRDTDHPQRLEASTWLLNLLGHDILEVIFNTPQEGFASELLIAVPTFCDSHLAFDEAHQVVVAVNEGLDVFFGGLEVLTNLSVDVPVPTRFKLNPSSAVSTSLSVEVIARPSKENSALEPVCRVRCEGERGAGGAGRRMRDDERVLALSVL